MDGHSKLFHLASVDPHFTGCGLMTCDPAVELSDARHTNCFTCLASFDEANGTLLGIEMTDGARELLGEVPPK